jgi:xanthine dehydrogenase YagS FAD-binding subunit
VATVGGNLLQDGRCPYYRGPWRCYRAGGVVCDAHHGINAEHAIFGASRCHIVSPSDTATALVALDARAVVARRGGRESVPVARLFVGPAEDILHMHRLHDGAVLVAIELDTDAPRRSVFIKATMRATWDFALASIAVSRPIRGQGWRVVLGGVAPIPWRLPEVEQLLERERVSPAVIAEATRLAVRDAEPLTHNRYKVSLVQKLVEEALQEISR